MLQRCNGSTIQRFNLLTARLHKHGRAVTQHFGDAVPNLRRIVADADDGVGAQFARVRQHLRKGVCPRSLAERRVKRDVPAEDRLDARAEITDHRARPHDDAPHHAKAFDHAIPGQFKSRRCQRMCLTHTKGIQHQFPAGKKSIFQRRSAVLRPLLEKHLF